MTGDGIGARLHRAVVGRRSVKGAVDTPTHRDALTQRKATTRRRAGTADPFIGSRRNASQTASLTSPERGGQSTTVATPRRRRGVPLLSAFSRTFLDESREILSRLDDAEIERSSRCSATTRERGGRLFLCGSGGGAGHASHAACDFRKLAPIESYCVTDNVSELTARINDDGWDSSYADVAPRVAPRRPPTACSCSRSGGGDVERTISVNLVRAMRAGAAGRCVDRRASSGATAASCAARRRQRADPTSTTGLVTPQTEGLQALGVAPDRVAPRPGAGDGEVGVGHRVGRGHASPEPATA